jgi:AraC-like DNA-binding protein
MDALADVLRAVRLTGGVFLDAEFTAPWCVSSQVGPEDCKPYMTAPTQIIAYHYVVAGRLLLAVGDGAPVEVRAGEIVMFPRNDGHRLGSSLAAPAIRAGHLIESPADGGLARIRHGGGGEATHIICGFLGSEARQSPLFSALPSLLKLDMSEGPGGRWIDSSFRFAAGEMARGWMGSATVLSKISELLFAEAVRRYLATLSAARSGWLAGLRDPIVGRALALLHGQTARAWTADELAREAGLSRSAFSDRFTAIMGEPPIRYLAGWRMQCAAQMLRNGSGSLAQIAAEVGYDSEAAFSRAFKRAFGQSPASWRKTVDQSDVNIQ